MYNRKSYLKYLICLLMGLLFTATVFAQGDIKIPPNEPFGDPKWNFKGRMNGNQVFETFWNHGEIGFWTSERFNRDDSDWPAGGDINPYLDGIAVVVGGSVVDTLGRRVHITSSNYREEVDRSPDLETIWGWHPIPGYLNFDRVNRVGVRNPIPAMSNDPSSWPTSGWLDQPDYFDEQGNLEWNGRFGRGKFNAQLETYYIVDDALDHEFGYVPDPLNPDRGGLGFRMAVRMYQWVHPLAQDVLFAEFAITNLGTSEVDSTAFGWWTDHGVGGTGSDNGLFAVSEDGTARDFDLAIGYDPPGETDINGLPTGLAGYAFLESPGIPDDFTDNDDDGIVDERRDNDAGTFIEDGGDVDAEKFLAFFGREPGPHWEGDEDQDWKAFEDQNGNNIWDFGEAINDDVGSDGVGPGDLNYIVPDPDGTEANLRPDQGEPNFGRVDNDESDQLGMTSFRMIPVPGHPNPRPNRFAPDWFSDDESWWERLSTDSIFATPATEENLVMIFASGVFPLAGQRTERFSMIIARSPGNESNLTEMLELKETVQAIFNTDYQFSQPPLKPTLTAVAGDGEVRLFWDKIAEESIDPFLGQNVKDFSGYRIYKSTDPLFSDIKVITNEDGSAVLKKPIAIFDLVDGYKGPHPINLAGASFDMGNESGLKNRFTDTDVINGLTYYYAVTAFDTGSVTRKLGPTENTTIIEVNNLGQPLFSDRNTVFVTPGPPAAGFNPPGVDNEQLSQVATGNGTGRILSFLESGGSEIVNPDIIETGTRYRVSFESELQRNLRLVNTTRYSVSRIEDGGDMMLLDLPWEEDENNVGVTDIFDGLILAIKNDTGRLDPDRTGWVDDSGEITDSKKGWIVSVRPDTGIGGAVPVMPHSDIEIRFLDADTIIAPKGRGPNSRKFLENIMINITAVAADTSVLFVSVIDVDNSDIFELENDALEIWEKIGTRNRTYWYVTFRPEDGATLSTLGDGDIVQIGTKKQFASGDSFEFSTNAAFIDQDEAKNALKDNKVAVVPNPYIFTNPLEPADPFRLGQESRLMFINVPIQATIRIFTLSGKLVDKIEVNNTANRGVVYWDLKSSEELRVAPGIYIFHIKDSNTGEEQIGRFVIIR